MKTARKDLNLQIGKRLQDARRNGGYTQEQFAESLDIGVDHYRKQESGKYGLRADKILTLYETYKINPTYLITGKSDQELDLDSYLMNCSKADRELTIDRMASYMKKFLI